MWRLRSAHANDVEALQRFVGDLSPATRVQRFFVPLRELPVDLVRALRQDDPAHRFVIAETGAEPIALGQLAVSGEQGEIALVVADAWQGNGVGSRLLARLLDEASLRGLREVVMELLIGNRGMRALARRGGFELQRHPGDPDLLFGRRRLAA
jgi:N-acetylglutamate synthase-like GNAT family acetyltransferase